MYVLCVFVFLCLYIYVSQDVCALAYVCVWVCVSVYIKQKSHAVVDEKSTSEEESIKTTEINHIFVLDKRENYLHRSSDLLI